MSSRAEALPLTAWRPAASLRPSGGLLLAGLAWQAPAAAALAWPDLGDWARTDLFASGCAGIGAVLLIAGLVAGPLGRAGARLVHWAPWFTLLALLIAVWEALSAKLGVLPQPFFPPPQALLEVYTDDFGKLGTSLVASVKLLAIGYAVGAVAGFLTGVAVGWSRAVGYWAHPVLRFLGPLPATAWLPVAFFAFPSSWSASVFLIALATGFPVTVLTWSGIAGVNRAYYDVARTLGAGSRFLVLRVAIPAALPHVFVGLFMGLGASFSVLVVAEMMGVKAGLGWYLSWAQGWASYANMYAALIVTTLLCSGAITLLFRIRDRLLSWQKGLVQW